uniref:cytidine deaminase n=1 Tax=Tanacetum cinerariifolium TaxID=118510 RepID=A0A6L2P094_TANCI|nr:cytidine deaminase 1-like [Tanacetum cinerariifolium]
MVQPPSNFILSSTEAKNLATTKNLTLPQLLPSLLKSAQLFARPAISGFAVGAVGLSSDGRVFFGANVEFKNLPLNHTIHAEQFLITNIAAHGSGGLTKVMNIAVSAAPCGHCRQFLQELRGVDDVQIVISDDHDQEHGFEPVYEAFNAILPYPFGPLDLLDHRHPLILEKCSNEISLKDEIFDAEKGNEPDLADGFRETIDKNEENLENEGFKTARGSHAPLKSGDINSLSSGDSDKNEKLTKDEGFAMARGSHAPVESGDVNSLSNGYSDKNELTKEDGFAVARGFHAPVELGDTNDLSNRYSDKNEKLTKDEGFVAARGSHVPVESGDRNDLSSKGYSELIEENGDLLKREAFAAARGSHAPYSGCPSGVALMDCEGKVYKGSYMESAACNPSMMPVQAAVVAYMVAGGGEYERIVAAVLVEKEDAVVRQEDTVRLILKNISPKCVLKVLHCY